jgi:hypothetical protein
LKYDPVWTSLHDDPRFKTIAENVRHHVDGQRNAFEKLRQKGSIPRRGSAGAQNEL